MPAGRPTKYKPEMLETIIDLMKEGASKVEVSAAIEISENTMHRWCDPNDDCYIEDFSRTIKKGVALSRSWWEREGRTALRDKDFNYTGWYMNMKNRFNWADKREHTVQGGEKPIKQAWEVSFIDATNADTSKT